MNNRTPLCLLMVLFFFYSAASVDVYDFKNKQQFNFSPERIPIR
ncbi:MAG: hypothetical protein ACXWV1_01950 [Chitinophagaceae bacterium]